MSQNDGELFHFLALGRWRVPVILSTQMCSCTYVCVKHQQRSNYSTEDTFTVGLNIVSMR